MKRIRISGREIVRDILDGATDDQLVEKYGLSLRSLAKVKNTLLERGSITAADLVLSRSSIPHRPSVSVADFLRAFRLNPDDIRLMSEFSLSLNELGEVYQFLVSGGFLSEYEYNCRTNNVSVNQPMNEVASEDSTAIDLTRGRSEGITSDIRRFLDTFEWACDSGTPGHQDGSYRQTASSNVSGSGLNKFECGSCPKCHTPKSPDSREVCLNCGVVFFKYEQHMRKMRVAIWS